MMPHPDVSLVWKEAHMIVASCRCFLGDAVGITGKQPVDKLPWGPVREFVRCKRDNDRSFHKTLPVLSCVADSVGKPSRVEYDSRPRCH
jgi:hypothetical protein